MATNVMARRGIVDRSRKLLVRGLRVTIPYASAALLFVLCALRFAQVEVNFNRLADISMLNWAGTVPIETSVE